MGWDRLLERFPDVVTRRATTVERLCTALDCVDVRFIPDGTLDQLSLPSPGRRHPRVGGIGEQDTEASALAAVVALAASLEAFPSPTLLPRSRPTGQSDARYTVRQATHDLRKLRSKQLVIKSG